MSSGHVCVVMKILKTHILANSQHMVQSYYYSHLDTHEWPVLIHCTGLELSYSKIFPFLHFFSMNSTCIDSTYKHNHAFFSLVAVWRKMVPKGSDIIRSCGLFGVNVVLLEKVCYCEVAFEVSYAQVTPTDHFLLSNYWDVRFSAPSPAPGMAACHHIPPWW